MKYPKFTTLLGLSTLSFHSSMMGKNHVRLTDEQCQQVEDHLSAEPENNQQQLTDLQGQLTALQGKYDTLLESNTAMTNALDTALNLNDLKGQVGETATNEEAIALLGSKCKEYGSSDNRHSFPKNNGETPAENGLINGVVNMNDLHNQVD